MPVTSGCRAPKSSCLACHRPRACARAARGVPPRCTRPPCPTRRRGSRAAKTGAAGSRLRGRCMHVSVRFLVRFGGSCTRHASCHGHQPRGCMGRGGTSSRRHWNRDSDSLPDLEHARSITCSMALSACTSLQDSPQSSFSKRLSAKSCSTSPAMFTASIRHHRIERMRACPRACILALAKAHRCRSIRAHPSSNLLEHLAIVLLINMSWAARVGSANVCLLQQPRRRR